MRDARPCSSRSPRASRPCSRAPARQARMPAGDRPEATYLWAGRISSTARRAHARGGRARPGLSGGVGFASTPRAPHRLAHVAQPICITDKAVPDGSAWFRVRQILRPMSPPHEKRPQPEGHGPAHALRSRHQLVEHRALRASGLRRHAAQPLAGGWAHAHGEHDVLAVGLRHLAEL